MKKVEVEHFQLEYMQYTKINLFTIFIFIISILILSIPLVLIDKYSKEKERRLGIRDTRPEEITIDQEEIIYTYPSTTPLQLDTSNNNLLENSSFPTPSASSYIRKYENDEYEEDDD